MTKANSKVAHAFSVKSGDNTVSIINHMMGNKQIEIEYSVEDLNELIGALMLAKDQFIDDSNFWNRVLAGDVGADGWVDDDVDLPVFLGEPTIDNPLTPSEQLMDELFNDEIDALENMGLLQTFLGKFIEGDIVGSVVSYRVATGSTRDYGHERILGLANLLGIKMTT